jgi:hypothetical protein
MTKYTQTCNPFAACVSGTFGNQCSNICHCINEPCNPTHGTCPPGGCQHEYKGNTCSTGTNVFFSVRTYYMYTIIKTIMFLLYNLVGVYIAPTSKSSANCMHLLFIAYIGR